MTKTLFLDDSYLKECDAVVQEVIEGRFAVLDQTVFYPLGGGQPSDTGKLATVSGPGFRVLDVMKKEGKILHEIEKKPDTQDSGLKAGDHVRCILDWERRYALMRMHTAAHVLAATMNRELGVLITGNQLGEDRARFDFNMLEFDRARFNGIVEKANALLAQDIELKIYKLPREEAMKIPGVVKLANALPPGIRELRIVEIPGIDAQADGGTHVKNLREAGQIVLMKCENKGKDNRRIYFALSVPQQKVQVCSCPKENPCADKEHQQCGVYCRECSKR